MTSSNRPKILIFVLLFVTLGLIITAVVIAFTLQKKESIAPTDTQADEIDFEYVNLCTGPASSPGVETYVDIDDPNAAPGDPQLIAENIRYQSWHQVLPNRNINICTRVKNNDSRTITLYAPPSSYVCYRPEESCAPCLDNLQRGQDASQERYISLATGQSRDFCREVSWEMACGNTQWDVAFVDPSVQFDVALVNPDQNAGSYSIDGYRTWKPAEDGVQGDFGPIPAEKYAWLGYFYNLGDVCENPPTPTSTPTTPVNTNTPTPSPSSTRTPQQLTNTPTQTPSNTIAPSTTIRPNTPTPSPTGVPVLTLEKTVSPQTVQVGGRVTYTVTVRNNSNYSTTVSRISDTFPNGFTYVQNSTIGALISSSNNSSSTMNGITSSVSGNVLTWNFASPITLPAGNSQYIRLTYNMTAASVTGSFVNTARLVVPTGAQDDATVQVTSTPIVGLGINNILVILGAALLTAFVVVQSVQYNKKLSSRDMSYNSSVENSQSQIVKTNTQKHKPKTFQDKVINKLEHIDEENGTKNL